MATMAGMVTIGLLSGIIYNQTSVYVAVLMGIILYLTRPESETAPRYASDGEKRFL
jgi:hypothetical protein